MAPQIQKTLQNKPGSEKMWYKLLKSGEKQRAYRLFRNSVVHRGELAFTPQKSTIVEDTENMFHDNAIYHVLKTSTVNGHFDLYYHPDYTDVHVKSSKPELGRHSVFITEMFRDEYPVLFYDLKNILREEYNSAMQKRKNTLSPEDKQKEELREAGVTPALMRLAKRKIRKCLDIFIIVTMREILRPGAGITAAYRKQIISDLTDALPSAKKIPIPEDGMVEKMLNSFQQEFRKNLMRTPYTMEHIINLFVNFKEMLLDETHPERDLSQALFLKRQYTDMIDLQRAEIEEIVYSAIEQYPQDIELFVNNLP